MLGCHPLLSGFLTNDHLLRVSHQSRLSGDNEIKTMVVHRSATIYFMGEKNLGKAQLGVNLMKTVRLVIASNGAPYIQMPTVVSQSTSVKEKKGRRKERMIDHCAIDKYMNHSRVNRSVYIPFAHYRFADDAWNFIHRSHVDTTMRVFCCNIIFIVMDVKHGLLH